MQDTRQWSSVLSALRQLQLQIIFLSHRFFLCVYVCVCLYMCLSAPLSVFLYVCLSVCLSIFLCLHLSFRWSVRLSLSLSLSSPPQPTMSRENPSDQDTPRQRQQGTPRQTTLKSLGQDATVSPRQRQQGRVFRPRTTAAGGTCSASNSGEELSDLAQTLGFRVHTASTSLVTRDQMRPVQLPKKHPAHCFNKNAFNGHTRGLDDSENGIRSTVSGLFQEEVDNPNQFYRKEFRVMASHPILDPETPNFAQMWNPNDKINQFQTMIFPSPNKPAARDQAIYLTKAVEVMEKRTAISMQHVAKVLGRVLATKEFNMLCEISLEHTMVDEVKLWDDALSEIGRQVGATCIERGELIEYVRKRLSKLFDFSFSFSSVVMSFLTDSRQQTAELENAIMRLQREKEIDYRKEGTNLSEEKLQMYNDHCNAVDTHSAEFHDTKDKLSDLRNRLEEHSKNVTSTLEYEHNRIQYKQLLQNMDKEAASRKRAGGFGLKEIGDAFLAMAAKANDDSLETKKENMEAPGPNPQKQNVQVPKKVAALGMESKIRETLEKKKQRWIQEQHDSSGDESDNEEEKDAVPELPDSGVEIVRKFGTIDGVEFLNLKLDKIQQQV
jgi:hypothetical protein